MSFLILEIVLFLVDLHSVSGQKVEERRTHRPIKLSNLNAFFITTIFLSNNFYTKFLLDFFYSQLLICKKGWLKITFQILFK